MLSIELDEQTTPTKIDKMPTRMCRLILPFFFLSDGIRPAEKFLDLFFFNSGNNNFSGYVVQNGITIFLIWPLSVIGLKLRRWAVTPFINFSANRATGYPQNTQNPR
jgi:hypothetical protein